MKDSSTTARGTTEAHEDRIQRVYLDTTRDAEFYGGHVWKVEYSQAYSHADRWFTTPQAANDYATEQERFRLALAARQEPPAGFVPDSGCGICSPCDCPQTFSGPHLYAQDGSMGITTAWSAADGVEFYIDQRPGARLDLAAARALHQLLGATIIEVEDVTA